MCNSSERLGVGNIGSTARELMTGAGVEGMVLTNLSNGRICEVSYTSLGAIMISEWYTRESVGRGNPMILKERTDWDNWRLPTEWELSFYDIVERYAGEFKLEEYNKRKETTGYDLVNMDYGVVSVNMDYGIVLGGDRIHLNTSMNKEGNIKCIEICYFSNVKSAEQFADLCRIQTINAGSVFVSDCEGEYSVKIK